MPAGVPQFDGAPENKTETVTYKFALKQKVYVRKDKPRNIWTIAERQVVAGRISYRLDRYGHGNTFLPEADLEAA